MAPLPAPAEKPSHSVSDSQSHAKVRPPAQVAVFCAAPWPNLQPALTGKARYAQRKWLSEAPNGWIKEVLGFRRFSLRGLAKVRGEWDLVCLALNIKRMGTVATC